MIWGSQSNSTIKRQNYEKVQNIPMVIQATDHQSKQQLHIKTAVILQHVSLHHETTFRETKYTTKSLTTYISTGSNSIKNPAGACFLKLCIFSKIKPKVFVAGCGVSSGPRQWFALGRPNSPFFVTGSRRTHIGLCSRVLCVWDSTVTFCSVVVVRFVYKIWLYACNKRNT